MAAAINHQYDSIQASKAVCPYSPAQPLLIPPEQAFDSHLSSIAPAQRLDPIAIAQPSRPLIHPPQAQPQENARTPVAIELELLNLQMTMEKNQKNHLLSMGAEGEKDLIRLDQLQKEELRILEEHAKKVSTRSTWGVLKNIATYFASATSFVLGIGLLATGAGTFLGGLLIASGALGLLNRVMSDTGAWQALVGCFTSEQETKDRVAKYLDTSLMALSIGMGLFSGIGSYMTGAQVIANSAQATNLIRGVQLASHGLKTAAGTGHLVVDAKVKKVEQQLTINRAETTFARYNLRTTFTKMQTDSEAVEDATRVAKTALEYYGSMMFN